MRHSGFSCENYSNETAEEKKVKKLSITCLEGAQKLWSKQLFSVLFFSLTFAIVVCTTGNRHTGCDSSQTWMSATSLLIISAGLAQLITTRKMKWFHLQAAHMATFCPIQPRLLAPGRIRGDWTAAVCFISVPDLQSTLCRGNTNLPIKIRCEQFAPWLRHIAIVFIWKKKKAVCHFATGGNSREEGRNEVLWQQAAAPNTWDIETLVKSARVTSHCIRAKSHSAWHFSVSERCRCFLMLTHRLFERAA